ncbi:MAG: hypothetical protein ACREBG_30615 [Pyrinomonadaceae bacterium]
MSGYLPNSAPFSARLLLLFPLALSFALSFSQCGTKKPAAPDTTVPIIKWRVVNSATGDQKNITGSADIAGKHGEHYKVSCFAEDPEGVHQIKLGGSHSYRCTDGRLATLITSDYIPQSQDLNPDSSGNVLTQIFLIHDVNLALDCGEWPTFSSGSVELTCRGTNYNGGNAEGGLLFHVARQ